MYIRYRNHKKNQQYCIYNKAHLKSNLSILQLTMTKKKEEFTKSISRTVCKWNITCHVTVCVSAYHLLSTKHAKTLWIRWSVESRKKKRCLSLLIHAEIIWWLSTVMTAAMDYLKHHFILESRIVYHEAVHQRYCNTCRLNHHQSKDTIGPETDSGDTMPLV